MNKLKIIVENSNNCILYPDYLIETEVKNIIQGFRRGEIEEFRTSQELVFVCVRVLIREGYLKLDEVEFYHNDYFFDKQDNYHENLIEFKVDKNGGTYFDDMFNEFQNFYSRLI